MPGLNYLCSEMLGCIFILFLLWIIRSLKKTQKPARFTSWLKKKKKEKEKPPKNKKGNVLSTVFGTFLKKTQKTSKYNSFLSNKWPFLAGKNPVQRLFRFKTVVTTLLRETIFSHLESVLTASHVCPKSTGCEQRWASTGPELSLHCSAAGGSSSGQARSSLCLPKIHELARVKKVGGLVFLV